MATTSHVESIDMTTPWILRGQGEIKSQAQLNPMRMNMMIFTKGMTNSQAPRDCRAFMKTQALREKILSLLPPGPALGADASTKSLPLLCLDQPFFADNYLVGSKWGAESIGVEHRGVGCLKVVT